MSYSKIPSKPFDTAQTPTDEYSASEPLIKGPKKGSRKPFSSDDQPRRNRILLARGFSTTFAPLVLLVICLWIFSKKRSMSKLEQRSFNTLSILLTATASLGLGSLLGHLGSMLRWPILARTVHQMQDVDSILGMSPPAGALRLIKRHIRERRISRTTFIVTAYLLTNVIGRLSVANFGLTFNMTDKKGIEYPVLATNWTSALWTRRIFPNGTTNSAVDKNSGEEFLSSSWSGLQKYAKSPDWALESARLRTGDDITPYIEPDLQVQNTALNVNGNTVKYSYNLKDFKEGYAIPSNHTVHSSANCSLIEVSDGRYWRWANGNRTGPFST
ncbi:unnamed protein product [Tuber melanosporum]|uniref:(Perigord truffle) hypothetical protein n=1 Tax=Tuber melanosporum (strain Mel28) TaxID=656061 RepID=D5GI62_TUBMM|nr:uncharacterized protein GSTUM_00008303001 [Tuber melanosporum]CAZ84205.1 unnamed protein product [Tuber melanosporum]